MMRNFRKWFLAICLMLCVGNTYAQHRYYCEVKGIEKDYSSGLKLIFDFGTKTSYTTGGLSSKLKFVDENGKEIKFNSMVDAANYMVDRGWTFQQAYSSFYGGNPIIHWIFYKDAENMEKAREGIITKSEYQKSQKK
jgi:hypothetical protein